VPLPISLLLEYIDWLFSVSVGLIDSPLTLFFSFFIISEIEFSLFIKFLAWPFSLVLIITQFKELIAASQNARRNHSRTMSANEFPSDIRKCALA